MVYYSPYIIGEYNPLYNLNNQGFFHCSNGLPFSLRVLGGASMGTWIRG